MAIAATGSSGINATPAIATTTAPRLSFWTDGWRTDFTKHSVPVEEITSGGPGKDGIPALTNPRLITLAEGDKEYKDREPVIAFDMNGDARAYPLQVLIWHEIANDEVGGVPVTVTFCPLCNTAIVFDRRLEGRVLEFGVSGNLRHSDMVMYDRQTESWWQQANGEAIVGEYLGKELTMLPAAIISWGEFKKTYPQGRVLTNVTGYDRDYGKNPYTGYDNIDEHPFLFKGTPDKRLAPKERVVTISHNGEDVAYPWPLLQKWRAINDRPGNRPVVVLWQPGVSSALDKKDIAGSRDIGAATTFLAEVDGRRLTFRPEGDDFLDNETNSRWTLTGRATAGPLAGKQLEPVVSGNFFWFAWAVFKPKTRIYQ